MAEDQLLPPLNEEDKMLCGLSYPGWFIIPAFVLLSAKKEDPFLCFHSLQGLVFGLLASIVTLVVTVGVWILFHVMPAAGGAGTGALGVVVFSSIFAVVTLLFIVSIFLGWQASSGSFLKIPFIGEWAELKMVSMLDLDYAAARAAAQPRKVSSQQPPTTPQLEPIPFPTDGLSGRDAEQAAAYARQLIQQQASPQQRPPAAPPQRPSAPSIPQPVRPGSGPAAAQPNVRPVAPPPSVNRSPQGAPPQPPQRTGSAIPAAFQKRPGGDTFRPGQPPGDGRRLP